MPQGGPSGSGTRPAFNPDADPSAIARDRAWKHAIPGHKKGVVTCWHCGVTYNGGGINRLKYHLAHIPRRDAKKCKDVPQDVMREMQTLLEEKMEKKELKKKQHEEMAQLAQQGSSSFRSPLSPTPPTDATASTSVTIGPRIRKQKSTLDSMFVPRTAPGAQPSLESMGWNKEKHDHAKLALGDFFIYNNISFNAARYLFI